MWTMNELINYIKRIQLRIDLQVTEINNFITEIQGYESAHIRYGATAPIIPKINYYTIDTGGFSTTGIRLFFPKDDEIILASGLTIKRIDPVTSTVGSSETITNTIKAHPLHLEYITDTYYGMGYSYNDDFSTETTFSPAEAFSTDATKNTVESNRLVVYKNTSKYTLNLDGTLFDTEDWLPEDRVYYKGLDLGTEVWNHRYIRTLRESGNVYFLDKYLVTIPDLISYSLGGLLNDPYGIRKIGNTIYFARLIGEYGELLHITRLELI